MRKSFVACALAALVLLVSMGGLAWFYWGQRTIWPEFAPVASENSQDSLSPQVVAEYERDFGWRTGDRVTIDIFIKQQPGTEVDLNTLAIQGDFEVSGGPDIFTRDKKDGSRLIRLRLPVQAFNLKPNWQLNATMTYRVHGQVDEHLITLPAVVLYSSPTWDSQRKEIKEDSAKPVFGWDLLVNSAIILGGIVLLIGCVRVIRRAKSGVDEPPLPVILSPRQIARREFLKVWALIMAGHVTEENYKEIERILRRLYRLEARTMREIDWELNNHPHRVHVVEILSLCDKVLYYRQILDPSEHERIWAAFNIILPDPAASRIRLVETTPRVKKKKD